MSSDYGKIEKDNIKEYGEGKRHLAILGRLFTDRTHFIFELLQNAEDAIASKILFKLFDGRLEVSHDGRVFDEQDVRGVCGVDEGTKAEDLTQIGKFGIGFKSVYAYTSSPEVHSGGENFGIKNYVRPYSVERRNIGDSWTTLFVFRFDAEGTNKGTAYLEIGKCLRNLSARNLLFLRNIKEIEYRLLNEDGVYLREEDSRSHARQVAVIGQNNSQDEDENWLIFKRLVTVPDGSGEVPVEVGFRVEAKTEDRAESVVKINDASLVVYFPTEKVTRLGFLVQGPYRTTPARDNVPEKDDWNKTLIKETAELVVESLRHLKEMELLSVSLLEALPIKTDDDFPEDGMFYPIFSRVRKALLSEELLPAYDGTFVAAPNAKLARSAKLIKLLDQDQLQALFQSHDEIRWLTGRITQDQTRDLHSYLMNELDVDEVTPDRFASNLSEEFLSKQTDEWFIRFYKFLLGQKTLWSHPRWRGDTRGILRNKPILRLEDGNNVNPFKKDNSPNAYLAVGTDTQTSFPIVKIELAQDEETRKFLEELGIQELDIVAEVFEKVLPKYMTDEEISDEIHKQDISKINRAYKTDSAEKKERLRKELMKTPFVLVKLKNREREYRKPGEVYFETDDLSLYFDGNRSVAFVDSMYSKSEKELFRNLDVVDHLRVNRRKENSKGYVIIHDNHSQHERGIAGFDPGIKVDGLENALESPSVKKSIFIWNRIVIPNSNCICGVVESSSRQTYVDSEQKKSESENFGRLLIDNPWLPNSDGHFHKPNELTLDDLPECFDRNEKLADQLGMRKDAVAKLLEEAHISEDNLNRARQFANAPPEVQHKIDSLLLGVNKKKTQQQERNSPYHKDLSEAFSKLGKEKADINNTGSNGGSSPNLSRRGTKISEDINAAIENEGEPDERFSFGIRKKWTGKNDQVRMDLAEWYGGRCQICEKTFTQSNGDPYFEGLYLVPYTTAGWIDRVGNVFCLCAWHCAMFQFGPREVEEDIIQQILRLKVQQEGGDGNPSIRMKLCGEPVEIKFSEKHLIDLQEMVKNSLQSEPS